MNKVSFNNTVLRDGHQSLAATRMTIGQMRPIAAALDEVGFSRLETWGGATIDCALRFLKENPFERLATLKQLAGRTPHMMLLRGQNLVQYTSFPDDVVEAFVTCSARRGMDVFRIFDALNDVRNLRTAVAAVKKAGKTAEGVICYTTSPVHTQAAFLELGDALVELGCDTICIKDMAGLIVPKVAHDLVRTLKQRHPRTPIVLHSHDTAGLAATSYCAAIDAGVDMIDTSIAPFANGTAQPDTLRMLALLEGHARVPRYEVKKLAALRDYFEGVFGELSAFTSPLNERVDSDTLVYQVPGGMLSNFRHQLKTLKMEDKFSEVLHEIPVVREALGWIPLVTPTSQIVGTQAMFNVKFGRWKNFTPAAMDIALGKYGKTPGPIDPEVRALAIKTAKQEPVDVRPADLLSPRMPEIRKKLAEEGLPVNDEMAVLYAMFPMELKAFCRPVADAPAKAVPAVATRAHVPSEPADATAATKTAWRQKLALRVNGKSFEAQIEER